MAIIMNSGNPTREPSFSNGTIYTTTIPDTTNHSVVPIPTNLGDYVFIFLKCGYGSAVAGSFTAVATDCQIIEQHSDVVGTTETLGYFAVKVTGNSPSLDVTYSSKNDGEKYVKAEYLGMSL